MSSSSPRSASGSSRAGFSQFTQARSATQSTGHLRDGRAHHVRVRKPDTDSRHAFRNFFERIRGSGRGIPKEKDQDSLLGQALADTTRGASAARGELRDGTWQEGSRLFFTRGRQGKMKGNAPAVSIFDGPHRCPQQSPVCPKTSPLSLQRLGRSVFFTRVNFQRHV